MILQLKKDDIEMSYVLVFAPLIGFLLTICFGKLLGDRISQTLTSSLVLVSTLTSFFYFLNLFQTIQL